MILRHARPAALVLACMVAALSCTTPGIPDAPSDPSKELYAASLGVDIPHMQKTTRAVYYSDKTVGTGATLSSSTAVVIDFVLNLPDATQISAQNAVSIKMSDIEVAGLPEGMLGTGATGGMKVGGTRLIVIGSALGYGNHSHLNIPANSTLVYTVTLKSFQ